MTRKDKKSLIIYLCIFIFGISLFSVTVGYAADYGRFEEVLYIGLSIAIIIFSMIKSIQKLYQIRHGEKVLIKEGQGYADCHNVDFITSRFLKEYSGLWEADIISENMPIQRDVTQLFHNMLILHRRRLDRLNIRQKFLAAKKKYTDSPFKEEVFPDGNYSATEAENQIEAVRCYYEKDKKKPFFTRRDKELAHFTVLSADVIGEKEIKCPNCGAISTREKLLDGCDYCGTRFVVEDLKGKVSGFALRDDADLSYEKYKENRIDRAFYAFYIFFAVIFFFIFFMMMIVILDPTEPYTGDGDPVSPLFLAFSIGGLAASFAAIAAGICELAYLFIFCPISEISAVAFHSYKKKAENLKESAGRDLELEKEIREFDPLFSMQVFYLNIQNKLSSIIFSENAEQINAFMESDHSDLLHVFDKTFDYDVVSLELKEYRHDEKLQYADIEAQLKCYEIRNGGKRINKPRIRPQTIKMNLAKSASCKTQTPGSPYVMKCPNCGDSLSLVDGMICHSCGTKADLKMFDWAIEDIIVE